MTLLVRSEKPDDRDLDGLGARVAELETLLGERDAEAAGVKSDLEAFRISYRQQVGGLQTRKTKDPWSRKPRCWKP